MMSEMGKKTERLGDKSSFSVTCNLLSQYIKEKGGLGDLGLGIAKAKTETFRPPTTMNLLPSVEMDRGATRSIDLFAQRAGLGPSEDAADVRKNTEKAQLTIFYGGKVVVYDNFPSDKAMDLMQLASKSGATAQTTGFLPPSSTAAVSTDHMNPNSTHRTSAFAVKPQQPIISYLPIARKASLHRFLEKRKDRITANGPYQVNGSKIKTEEATESWLGLGPRIAEPAACYRV